MPIPSCEMRSKFANSKSNKKKLELRSEFAATKVYLQADPARLQQIFWNLIKNAVKFTPHGGKLGIRTTNNGDRQFRLEAEDSGWWIDPGLLPRIVHAIEQARRTQSG